VITNASAKRDARTHYPSEHGSVYAYRIKWSADHVLSITGRDYAEMELSLDERLISHPAASFFLRAIETRRGSQVRILQGAPCDINRLRLFQIFLIFDVGHV